MAERGGDSMKQRVFDGMEYVYAVYREGSFQKAAEKLFVSQPSVSASVRRVEERAGSRLFDRSRKPLALTECGEAYIACAEKIFAMERDFTEYVNDWEGLRRGRVAVGGSSLFSSLLLPPMMASFRERYPGITLTLAEETTPRLEEMLRQGTVDLVVDYTIPNMELYDSATVREDALILAVPRAAAVNARLAPYRIAPEEIGAAARSAAPGVPMELLKDESFVLLKPENDTRARADALCRLGGFEPKTAMEFDQQMTAYLAGCSGAGITFVSSVLVSRLSPNPGICYYRLPEPESRRDIRLFWKRGRYKTRAMEAFLAMPPENGGEE